jgi:hypothetical protein
MGKNSMAQPRTVFQMPFLLMVTMGVHAATAIWFVLAILLAPIGFNFLNYQVNGQAVQGLEFVRAVGVRLMVGAAISTFVANALWSEKRWGREAIMVASVLLTLWFFLESMWAGGSLATAIESMVDPFLLVVFYGWYLYRKATVKAYYRAITAQPPSLGVQPSEVSTHGV